MMANRATGSARRRRERRAACTRGGDTSSRACVQPWQQPSTTPRKRVLGLSRTFLQRAGRLPGLKWSRRPSSCSTRKTLVGGDPSVSKRFSRKVSAQSSEHRARAKSRCSCAADDEGSCSKRWGRGPFTRYCRAPSNRLRTTSTCHR